MKKFGSIALVLVVISCGTKERLQVKAFESGGGYGYRIISDGKVIVHQQTIPALAGNRVFCNRAEALSVGNEVAKKLLNHESPAIRVTDLQRLNINTGCQGVPRVP